MIGLRGVWAVVRHRFQALKKVLRWIENAARHYLSACDEAERACPKGAYYHSEGHRPGTVSVHTRRRKPQRGRTSPAPLVRPRWGYPVCGRTEFQGDALRCDSTPLWGRQTAMH